jgi:hypothetical protein
VEDLKQGVGKLVLSNDEYFEGSFYEDMIDGRGKFVGRKGVVRGTWEANKLIQME